jgi:hypothetical protein
MTLTALRPRLSPFQHYLPNGTTHDQAIFTGVSAVKANHVHLGLLTDYNEAESWQGLIEADWSVNVAGLNCPAHARPNHPGIML